jgi:hypothetical protein
MSNQKVINNLQESGISKKNLIKLCENSYNFNNMIVFYKYLKQIISTNQSISSQINSINMKDLICKNNMKNLFKLNNKNKNSEYGIILEVNNQKKKIKILRLENNMDYITDLLVYIRDNLKISITGSCAISQKHKIKLHYNEINPISNISKPISLCIPEGNPYIVEHRYKPSNNLSSFPVGEIIALTTKSQSGGVILESISASAAVGSSTGIAMVLGLPLVMFFIGVLLCEN